jgi:hypothetical protein
VKPCPNCHFLVSDDTDRCSVCKQPIATAADPSAPAEGATTPWAGAPDAAAASSAATGAAVHQRSRRPVAQRGRRSNIGLLSVVGVFVLAAVVFAFVYRMNTGGDFFGNLFGFGQYRIEVSESDWAPYRDPDGRFSVELPGTPELERPTVDTGAGPVRVDTVLTEEPAITMVAVVPVPPGAQVDLPGAMEGFAEGGSSSGMQNAIVTQSNEVATPFGPGIRGRVDGVIDGQEAVMSALAFLNGSNLYLVSAIGPAAQTAAVLDIQDRMSTSLAIPAA